MSKSLAPINDINLKIFDGTTTLPLNIKNWNTTSDHCVVMYHKFWIKINFTKKTIPYQKKRSIPKKPL